MGGGKEVKSNLKLPVAQGPTGERQQLNDVEDKERQPLSEV